MCSRQNRALLSPLVFILWILEHQVWQSQLEPEKVEITPRPLLRGPTGTLQWGMQNRALLCCSAARRLHAQRQEGSRKAREKPDWFLPANISSYANSSKREEGEAPTESPAVSSWFSGIKQLLQSRAVLCTSILRCHALYDQSGQGQSLILCAGTAHRGVGAAFLPLQTLLWVRATLKSQHLYKKFYCSSSIPFTRCKCKFWTLLAGGGEGGKKEVWKQPHFPILQPTNLFSKPGCVTAVIALHSLGVRLSIHMYMHVWIHTHTLKL